MTTIIFYFIIPVLYYWDWLIDYLRLTAASTYKVIIGEKWGAFWNQNGTRFSLLKKVRWSGKWWYLHLDIICINEKDLFLENFQILQLLAITIIIHAAYIPLWCKNVVILKLPKKMAWWRTKLSRQLVSNSWIDSALDTFFINGLTL